MWLLDTTTYELRMFIVGSTVPPYAILSHTWGFDELVDPYTGERRSRTVTSGLLADSPVDFAHSHDVHQRALLPPSPFREFSMTNMGLSITANLVRLTPITGGPRASPAPQSVFVMPIGASGRPNDTSPRTRIGLYLEPVLVAASRAGHKTSYFRRVMCDKFCFASTPTGEFPQGELANIYILEDDQFAEMQFADRPPTPRPGSASGSGSDGGGNWSPSIGARLSLSPSPSPRPFPESIP
ncbi:hypothetical protein CaCOL14_007990 [Colletotrichum acutatum]